MIVIYVLAAGMYRALEENQELFPFFVCGLVRGILTLLEDEMQRFHEVNIPFNNRKIKWPICSPTPLSHPSLQVTSNSYCRIRQL